MIPRTLLGGLTALILAMPLAAQAGEADVRKGMETFLGNGFKVESIRKIGALNLYEVQVGGDLLYTDDKVTHVFIGNIIDAKAKKDLTEERKAKLAQIKFSDLPLELAIKQVRGNGKRVVATFEDPNCTYCKKLAKELAGVNDVTIYTFLYPILSPDSTDKSKAIWCAPDKAKAWNDYMINGTTPAAASCDHPVDKIVALGRKLNIRGTPTIFLADGSRVPGFMPVPQLEQAMNRAASGN